MRDGESKDKNKMLISFIKWRLKNLGKIFIDSSIFIFKYFDEFIKKIVEAKAVKILALNAEVALNSITISWKYGLLPNDALIAATCKLYGITKIATLDPDFERVDFLEVFTA